jgi:hypothetical protein
MFQNNNVFFTEALLESWLWKQHLQQNEPILCRIEYSILELISLFVWLLADGWC